MLKEESEFEGKGSADFPPKQPLTPLTPMTQIFSLFMVYPAEY
jgi:hypothetical protein